MVTITTINHVRIKEVNGPEQEPSMLALPATVAIWDHYGST